MNHRLFPAKQADADSLFLTRCTVSSVSEDFSQKKKNITGSERADDVSNNALQSSKLEREQKNKIQRPCARRVILSVRSYCSTWYTYIPVLYATSSWSLLPRDPLAGGAAYHVPYSYVYGTLFYDGFSRMNQFQFILGKFSVRAH